MLKAEENPTALWLNLSRQYQESQDEHEAWMEENYGPADSTITGCEPDYEDNFYLEDWDM